METASESVICDTVLYTLGGLVKCNPFYIATRIRSVERGICPIASLNVTN